MSKRAATSPGSRGMHSEAGIALVSVIGLTAVLTLVAVVSISFTLSAQRFSRNHQDWNAALGAAEAGIDDFLARLNRDRQYFERYESDLDGDGRNLNPAIDRWAELPGTSAWYHYRVDDSEVLQAGTVTLTSTGRVGDETRSIQVRIRPESFFDFIYLTDFEVVDPDISGRSGCENYFGSRPTECNEIRFASADVLDGAVHSNDAIQIEGTPQFLDVVTTSYNPPSGGYVNFRDRFADPFFFRAGDPAHDVFKNFPPTNDQVLVDAANHGCVYYGPTYIHLDGETMTVRSPLTDIQRPADAPPTTVECGNVGSALGGFVENLEIPPVIYVENATACAPFSNANDDHPLGVDRQEESNTSLRYNCRFGDAFVWGELDTQLTIAARNNVSIIWDLIYQDGEWQDGTNILGLVADNFVQVRMPRTDDNTGDRGVARRPPFPTTQPTGTNTDDLWRDPTIHAAILSVERSFRVQNHNAISPLGTLSVYGSISQKFRGPVGTGSAESMTTGFAKDYRYDQRLRGVSPPFFLDPVRSRYVVRSWAEVRDAVGHPDGLPVFPNPEP